MSERGQSIKREGSNRGDIWEDRSPHGTQPMRNWERNLHATDKMLPVTTLSVSAHQTPDLARPSLKPCFSLYLVSPSPLFEFGPVGFISYSSTSKIKPKKSYIFSHNNF